MSRCIHDGCPWDAIPESSYCDEHQPRIGIESGHHYEREWHDVELQDDSDDELDTDSDSDSDSDFHFGSAGTL